MQHGLQRAKDEPHVMEGAGPRPGTATPTFRFDIARSLSMHRTLAAVTTVIVFALVLAFGLSRTQTYEASTTFYVPAVHQDLLQSATPAGFDSARYDSTFQQLLQTIQRQDVLQNAVRSLPEGVWRQRGEPVGVAAARLGAGLNVVRMGQSYQMGVSLAGQRPADTAEALDALSKQFLRTLRRDDSGADDEQLEVLKNEQARVRANIRDLRQQQTELGATLGVARLTADSGNPFDASVDELRKQIADVRHAGDLAATQIPGAGGNGGGGEGGSGSNTTSGLIYGLNSRKAILQSQMSGMTAANPIYQQDQVELQSLDRELLAATRRYRNETETLADEQRGTTLARVNRLEEQLQVQLARQTQAAINAGPKLQQYSSLGAEIERLQTRDGNLDETIRTRTLEANSPDRVHVVVPPVVPTQPMPGRRRLILLSALPLALFAGVFAAVFAHQRDGRIFLGSDLEKVLGFKPMAVLPVPAEVSETVSEGYLLRLAASIENAYRLNHARSFLFTAPNAETDVEDLVFRLQTKLKELGYAPLWIGAETLLRAERDFEEAYGRGPSLDAVARYSKAGSEGYATARLNWLKQDYDLLLIDAPPLTASAEAEYAIRRTDATILVNESGVTTRADLQVAGELLERIGLGSVGAVIKDLHLRDADDLYRSHIEAAERVSARPVNHDPHDGDGHWEVLEAGSPRELHLPGDPLATHRTRRTRESILQERAEARRRAQAKVYDAAVRADDVEQQGMHDDRSHAMTLS